MEIAGEMVGWESLVKSFTKVTGQPAVFKRQPLDEWWKNFTNVDKPIANEKSAGDGSTTMRENFSAFWRMWRDDILTRDMEWIRSIHPKLQGVEDFMKTTGYHGNLGKSALLKNVEDGKGNFGVDFAQAKRL